MFTAPELKCLITEDRLTKTVEISMDDVKVGEIQIGNLKFRGQFDKSKSTVCGVVWRARPVIESGADDAGAGVDAGRAHAAVNPSIAEPPADDSGNGMFCDNTTLEEFHREELKEGHEGDAAWNATGGSLDPSAFRYEGEVQFVDKHIYFQ